MAYDKNNIFAKILRGEIPCKRIYENEYILSFYDINPQKKVHALVITKGEYIDLDDFSSRASEKEISELIKGISFVAKKLGISFNDNGKGYRSLVNIGEHGGQDGSIKLTIDGYDYPVNKKLPSLVHSPKDFDLILFPSSLFHRTIPFKSKKTRHVIAFDLIPF